MKQFAVQELTRDDARIISIRGEFVAANLSEVDFCLLDPVGDPDRVLIVSLTECEFIDSAAVALLLATYRRGVARGGRGMSIVCADDSEVGRRLRRAGLDQAISIYTSLEDAAVALESGREL